MGKKYGGNLKVEIKLNSLEKWDAEIVWFGNDATNNYIFDNSDKSISISYIKGSVNYKLFTGYDYLADITAAIKSTISQIRRKLAEANAAEKTTVEYEVVL